MAANTLGGCLRKDEEVELDGDQWETMMGFKQGFIYTSENLGRSWGDSSADKSTSHAA